MTSRYKALLTAVDMGTFSAAAKALGYTQSGLTHMMNALEEEIGFPILERGFWGVRLTEMGERLIPRIRELVNCEETLENEIRIVRAMGESVLRIGAYSSITQNWLPAIVERYEAEYPEITVNIQTGTVEELYRGLEEGRFDMVIGSKLPKYQFSWITLAKDPFFAVLPSDYPVDEGAFPISAFNGTKFLMPGLGFDGDISAVFAAHSVKPFVTQTYVDDPAIVSMVEHRRGISMLSELIIRNMKTGAVRFEPVVPEVYRTLGVALRTDSTPTQAAKKFITMTKEFIQK